MSVPGVKERRNSVIAGKFAADFTEELPAMMKEYAPDDNLPAKQSRWEISLHNARNLSWMRHPASDKSSVGHTCWAPINFRLAHPINQPFGSVRHWLVPFRQEFRQNRKVLHWILRRFRVGLNIDDVGWRVPGKILLESAPGAWQNPATGIQTWDASPENIARKRKGCDVTRGRTPVGL